MYKPLASSSGLGGVSVPRWYVCRYHTLTKQIRDLESIDADGMKVYFPMVKPSAQTKRQLDKSNHPVLPGFIFVRSTLSKIEKDYRFAHCFVLKTHVVPSRPVNIPDGKMVDFQKVASILVENPVLVYSEEFDSKALNIVEFEDAAGDSRLAYLETSQGAKGGSLLVPFRQEELERAFFTHANLDALELPPHTLCYKVPADNDGFAIRHIVRSSKYDLEYVNKATRRATQSLRRLSAGETLKERDKSILGVYLHRYRRASTSSPKFQAKIALLVFASSLALQDEDESQRLKAWIEDDVLHTYRRYVRNVRKDNRPTARRAFESFVQAYDEVKAVAEKMKRPTYDSGE